MGAEVLYLRGETLAGEIRGGADIVSSSALRILKGYFGSGAVEEFYVDQKGLAPSRFSSLGRALAGRYPSYSRGVGEALAARCAQGIKFLFVDQSVYALACADAKKAAPDIKCAVLFHNVERNYYLRRALRAFKPHNLLLVPAVVRAERAAVREADLLVVLSRRDADELQAVYGRRPELALPPALEDRGPAAPRASAGRGRSADSSSDGPVMLFVGSAFPPNVQGVRWFAKNVLPRVPGRFLVAGRGFEALRGELEGERVKILGGVPELGPVYAQADLVVSPIFWGSGIKIKTAEAFMYGMPFVGSAEALEGYDAHAAGALRADDAESFAAALAALSSPAFRAERAALARAYFVRELSFPAADRQLSAALDKILAK